MELKVWLWKKGLSMTEFSKLICISRSHMSLIVNGRKRPSKRLAYLIERYTQGDVKAEQFFDKKKSDDTNAV